MEPSLLAVGQASKQNFDLTGVFQSFQLLADPEPRSLAEDQVLGK